MASEDQRPWGYKWRSSKGFITSTIIIALYTETFLYGFVVPILGYMLEARLRMDPSKTQRMTTAVLTVHGFVSLVSAPIIAHFADQTPNRKAPLLMALAGCIIGTLLVASTFSIETLFIGRVLQAIAGSAAWIVGLATLSENVGLENMGKVLGLSMTFVTAGQISGPIVGGTLLELVGYWPTWSAPMIALFLDMIARRLMIERGVVDSSSPLSSKSIAPSDPEDRERAPLLPPLSDNNQSGEVNGAPAETQQIDSPGSFYRTMLSDARVVASVANVLIFSTVISAFDATLPLHLRDVFHWNTLSVGLIFLSLQVPSMLLGPVIGWFRDRAGVRYPATIGWLLMAPLLWFLGVPGEERFPWASPETNGETMFVVGLVGIGIVITLVRGAGTVQLVAVTKDMETKNPNIFGEFGGSNRIFSMTEVAFSLGSMLGPLISGTLSEAVGYFYMNIVLGSICLLVALSCFLYFRV
ncbi:major facilitator superfamily domain-containing protein [Aspergillus alliaceus]|uniref:major facilitator superfamily domain-containing protein n=1 Tax=Petromyces alliaceus TaxID=209559 RepID=UPI0012A70227|nr:major facilitator superfamily domain-containing protein [Aspergillus alliaceus]KAB8229387.1 major facilitator superfamily domain-containing protein [Aspergillus alliaceus]